MLEILEKTSQTFFPILPDGKGDIVSAAGKSGTPTIVVTMPGRKGLISSMGLMNILMDVRIK